MAAAAAVSPSGRLGGGTPLHRRASGEAASVGPPGVQGCAVGVWQDRHAAVTSDSEQSLLFMADHASAAHPMGAAASATHHRSSDDPLMAGSVGGVCGLSGQQGGGPARRVCWDSSRQRGQASTMALGTSMFAFPDLSGRQGWAPPPPMAPHPDQPATMLTTQPAMPKRHPVDERPGRPPRVLLRVRVRVSRAAHGGAGPGLGSTRRMSLAFFRQSDRFSPAMRGEHACRGSVGHHGHAASSCTSGSGRWAGARRGWPGTA